jgi:hypothetical protein
MEGSDEAPRFAWLSVAIGGLIAARRRPKHRARSVVRAR